MDSKLQTTSLATTESFPLLLGFLRQPFVSPPPVSASCSPFVVVPLSASKSTAQERGKDEVVAILA